MQLALFGEFYKHFSCVMNTFFMSSSANASAGELEIKSSQT